MAPASLTHVFAGIPTTDFDRALGWYRRLLGRPPDRFPHAAEAVWQLTDSALIYVVTDPQRAGNGLITLFVGDLGAWANEVAGRGISVPDAEVLPGKARTIALADPDGNKITVGQVLAPVD